MHQTFLDAEAVSEIYFVIGMLSLAIGLLTPWLSRIVPRGWLYSSAIVMMLLGNLLAMKGGTWPIALALMAITLATVVITICFNAYAMDYFRPCWLPVDYILDWVLRVISIRVYIQISIRKCPLLIREYDWKPILP